jgi:aspartyl-tRNA(Asn)/glutamyl-tRNA(Gln) amidotransferase subunit C
MNTEQVQKLAELARLDVPESELAQVAGELGNILGFIDEIQKVDIGTEEARDLSRVNVFRDDIVAPIKPIHDLIEVAPLHQDHFVKVPKVIGE